MSAPVAPAPKRTVPESPSRSLGRRLLKRIGTSNPFYVISAALVLLGLRTSFDPDSRAFPTWALLLGLGGYTLLMVGTAIGLVRRLRVWDDVRTLLLLVVTVLLAIPAFFDDILARDARLGSFCEAGGLIFAVAVSELLLRGLRLRLPIGFRGPYHLALGLFYLYPVALAPWMRSPDSSALAWGLLGFPAAAGLVALTLLPAIRRGAGYPGKDASPWRWPLYPWSAFVFLGLGVGPGPSASAWRRIIRAARIAIWRSIARSSRRTSSSRSGSRWSSSSWKWGWFPGAEGW